jgi:hypothetical protein
MRTIESIQPSSELQGYVRAYAERRMELSEPSLIARVPARLEQTLEFQFEDSFRVHFDDDHSADADRITVTGPQTRFRASVEFRGRIHSFAIFFQPSGFSRLFGLPMRLLLNRAEDATSVVGRRCLAVWNELGSERLRESCADCRTVSSGSSQAGKTA